MTDKTDPDTIHCPSAQPGPDAAVIGVVTSQDGEKRIGYLTEPQPVTPEVLALAGQASPTGVLRIAAPCMGEGCKHFAGGACKLVTRIVASLDPVVGSLPACGIRPTCRWFRQDGPAACVRCPQVMTTVHDATEDQRLVYDPD